MNLNDAILQRLQERRKAEEEAEAQRQAELREIERKEKEALIAVGNWIEATTGISFDDSILEMLDVTLRGNGQNSFDVNFDCATHSHSGVRLNGWIVYDGSGEVTVHAPNVRTDNIWRAVNHGTCVDYDSLIDALIYAKYGTSDAAHVLHQIKGVATCLICGMPGTVHGEQGPFCDDCYNGMEEG